MAKTASADVAAAELARKAGRLAARGEVETAIAAWRKLLLGQKCNFLASDLPNAGAAVLALGVQSTALPLSYPSGNVPNCTLFVIPDITLLQPSSRQTLFALSLPNISALRGAILLGQVLGVDPQSVGALSLTPAVVARMGSDL